MLLTQSPHGRMTRGRDLRVLRSGFLPEPTGCAQCQSEQGRAAELSSGTVSAHGGSQSVPIPPGPLPAHLPPARGASPREATTPTPTVHPPAGCMQADVSAPTACQAREPPAPDREIHWQGHGLYKTLELSRLRQVHLEFTRGAVGPVSAIYLTVKGQPQSQHLADPFIPHLWTGLAGRGAGSAPARQRFSRIHA